jgi:hypothetical protein
MEIMIFATSFFSLGIRNTLAMAKARVMAVRLADAWCGHG